MTSIILQRHYDNIKSILADAERANGHPATIASLMLLIHTHAHEITVIAGMLAKQNEPQA